MIKADNCFLTIDKPAGISSFEVIRVLRRITGIRKIGHTGTLDPFATGLLICCLGSYTRLASLVEAADKTYLARLKFGSRTSTGDTEGEIVETATLPDSKCNWQELASKALLLKELPIPAYSAVKVNGSRAYSLARKGETPDLPLRQTQLKSFGFLPETMIEDGRAVESICYRCTVSKGTYIRSLSEWLASQLGTVGTTIELRREAIADIRVNSSHRLELLSGENWRQCQLDPLIVLSGLPVFEVDAQQAAGIRNGIGLPWPDGLRDGKIAIYYETELLAIGEQKGKTLHPSIVLV